MIPTAAEIRAVRQRAGLTQTEAARLAGYSNQPAWAAVESGARAIDPVRWRYFLHVAGIEKIPFRAARLVGGATVPPPA